MDVSIECKKKIVLDFDEFPPSKNEKKIYEHFHLIKKTNSSENQKLPFYLSSIEEKNEMPSMRDQNKRDAKIFKISEKLAVKPIHDYKRKYHTYPKYRIPVSKCSKERRLENYAMNSRIFPLEPREIDLEFFQQLHIAELQEFLLLESQCSGNFGLAGNIFISYNEYCIEDDRGTVSGKI